MVSRPVVDHVARQPVPWRTGALLTECGREIDDDTRLIDHGELATRVRDLGQRRAAFSTCMTCWDTARRWSASWDANPAEVMAREVQNVYYSMGRLGGERGDPEPLIVRELRALAELVRRHSDEFAELMEGLDKTVRIEDLAAKRAAEQRRARAGRPQRPIGGGR
jgi:hypothetical protein